MKAEGRGSKVERRQSPQVPAPAVLHLRPSSFDLRHSLECGQVFHWRPYGSGYIGMIGYFPCHVEQRGDTLLVPRGLEETARHYATNKHRLDMVLRGIVNNATILKPDEGR